MLYNLTITPQGGFLFSPEGSVTTPPVPPNPPTPPAPPAPQPPAPPPPAPSVGGANYCPPNQRITQTINASETYKKISSTGLVGTTTMQWVVKLVVEEGDTTVGKNLARLSWAEASGQQRVFRTISISKNMCDYTHTPGTTFLLTKASNSGSRQIAINDNMAVQGGASANLTPGTWYINFKNISVREGTLGDGLLEWVN